MDAICAVATGQGGAIGVIRVSGDNAITIADGIFTPAAGSPLSGRRAYTIAYGTVRDAGGGVIDDVLVSVFRAPHSYTGEDSVEISCHGSAYILQKVMQLLIDHGCRAAGPGEYTRRAFMNGKMDLSQAEAVADLIASSSAAAHRMAVNQMRGAFSRQLSKLRGKLLNIASLMELELDFSDHEDVEFASRKELDTIAADVEVTVGALAASFTTGEAIRNGVSVAIAGRTNVGKSTLLNVLVGDERAIVSDVHGTTRDTIEDSASFGGIKFRIIDTAGIRDTSDKIEAMGVERSVRAVEEADIILLVCEYGDALPPCMADGAGAPAKGVGRQPSSRGGSFVELYERLRPKLQGKKVLVAVNKCDSAFTHDGNESGLVDASHVCGECGGHDGVLFISALKGINIGSLRQALVRLASVGTTGEADVIVTNARHYEALTLACGDIRRVREGLSSGVPADLICEDLRLCLRHLGEITGGEITSQETLDNIFSHFCIGK